MTAESRVRVVIVDDEPLARETLRLLMRRDPSIDIVGECQSGAEAVETIGRLAPDLVFLDIQMPELDGFQVLARLTLARRPIVVFVTAYDRYALDAFAAHALDYLVKPFTDERFYATLERAKQYVRERAFGLLGERVLSLLQAQGLTAPALAGDAAGATAGAAAGTTAADPDPLIRRHPGSDGPARGAAPAGPKPLDRLAVKENGRVLFVRVTEIDWIEACDYYVRLHVGGAAHELRQPLKDIATRLDPRRFVRIHRSAIVNLDRVQELQPHFHGNYLVVLKNGTSLPLSRARREELRTALGGLLP
jgi:two-component system LytT family response regulator